MATVAKAMATPESGLEVRDRMWLKITIANAFIGRCNKQQTMVELFLCNILDTWKRMYDAMRVIVVVACILALIWAFFLLFENVKTFYFSTTILFEK